MNNHQPVLYHQQIYYPGREGRKPLPVAEIERERRILRWRDKPQENKLEQTRDGRIFWHGYLQQRYAWV